MEEMMSLVVWLDEALNMTSEAWVKAVEVEDRLSGVLVVANQSLYWLCQSEGKGENPSPQPQYFAFGAVDSFLADVVLDEASQLGVLTLRDLEKNPVAAFEMPPQTLLDWMRYLTADVSVEDADPEMDILLGLAQVTNWDEQ